MRWMYRKITGRPDDEDESYLDRKVKRIIKAHGRLYEKMEAKLQEYEDLQKLHNIARREKKKLEARIHVFKQHIERLQDNLEELLNSNFTEADKRLSEIHREYHDSRNAYSHYEVASSDKLNIKSIKKKNEEPDDNEPPSLQEIEEVSSIMEPNENCDAKTIHKQNSLLRQHTAFLIKDVEEAAGDPLPTKKSASGQAVAARV